MKFNLPPESKLVELFHRSYDTICPFRGLQPKVESIKIEDGAGGVEYPYAQHIRISSVINGEKYYVQSLMSTEQSYTNQKQEFYANIEKMIYELAERVYTTAVPYKTYDPKTFTENLWCSVPNKKPFTPEQRNLKRKLYLDET